MLSEANDKLIQEYLNVVIHASEDVDRFLNLLSDDCVWYITPPGVTFKGKEQLTSFTKFAMSSRTHTVDAKIEVRNWFAGGENFCIEYFHGAVITGFPVKVVENVCLVCHMRDGKFDRVHEYVDTSASFLIGLGLKFLPLIVKLKSPKHKPSGTST